ncbi:hypothetical protein J437_LFUL011918 [Ladona fulva]|uniref:G-protein coupled receptors family 1 profile domain-containing protein n=1 Tax=Ladona fulva TaxID=123851 RepID=A0A8K0JVI4_LADFU|nr:hypothetical protein J437_LFUL011918 [Ladona fulva]
MVTMDAGPRGNNSSGGSGTMLRMLGAAQRREVKATQNLAIIVLFFILCWIPLYTINCIKAFCPDCPVEGPLTYFCIILSHLNSAVNPFLYAYHLRDFRAALRAIFGGDRKRRMQRHKFLHLNDDGPAITHAATAPAAIRSPVGQEFLKKPPEPITNISAAISSTRCLVAAAVFPEALAPEGLMDSVGMTPPPSLRRGNSTPQRVMSEGCASEYRKRFTRRIMPSAVSCPEAEIRSTSPEEVKEGDGDREEEGDEVRREGGVKMVLGDEEEDEDDVDVETISEVVRCDEKKDSPNGDIPMADDDSVVVS